MPLPTSALALLLLLLVHLSSPLTGVAAALPKEELYASCAVFAGDVYNETPLDVPAPLPGWRHVGAYRFHLMKSGKHDGYADAYRSDQHDYIIAIRGSLSVNPDYSYKREPFGGLIPNPLAEDADQHTHNRVQGLVWHKTLRYAASHNVLKGEFTRAQLLSDARHMCQRKFRIAFTGHGYGGAVATFLAWKLRNLVQDYDCDIQVVTFGMPPAATEEAVMSFFHARGLSMKRFVMQCFDESKAAAFWDASVQNDPDVARTDADSLVDFGPETVLVGRFQPLWKSAHRLANELETPVRQIAAETCHDVGNYVDALQHLLHSKLGYRLAWCSGSVREPVEGEDVVRLPAGELENSIFPKGVQQLLPPARINSVEDFDVEDTRTVRRHRAHADPACAHTPSYTGPRHHAGRVHGQGAFARKRAPNSKRRRQGHPIYQALSSRTHRFRHDDSHRPTRHGHSHRRNRDHRRVQH